MGPHCYRVRVRQLITRIDEDLHRRLKERARDEGRSLNALVTQILEEAVPDESPRARLRRRLRERGMLVELNAMTEDSQEGVASFRERRPPAWRGW